MAAAALTSGARVCVRPAGTQTADRNEHHAANFNRYAALPLTLGHVVELGCGPYTQTQSILRPESVVTSLTLVDPLAAHYATRTRGCTYKVRAGGGARAGVRARLTWRRCARLAE